MLKSNNVRIFKALAMGALLSNGGISTEKENIQDHAINGPLYNVGVIAEADRDEHTARFASSLMSIGEAGDQISSSLIPTPIRSDRMPRAGGGDNPNDMNSIINQYLDMLDQRASTRQNIMRQPRTIDLGVKPLDNVHNFLENARRYSAKVKLRLLNITPQQLDEILNGVNEEIEELDWTYRPMPISATEDLDEEDSKYETKSEKDLDDEEDDIENTGMNKKKTKKGDGDADDIGDDDWDDHLDRDGILVPGPRRGAARGRDPLRLADLLDGPDRGANLVPPNRIVDVPIPVANGNNVHVQGGHGIGLPNGLDNLVLVNARVPMAKSYASNSPNPLGFDLSRPHTQVTAHHLVNVFCKNHNPRVEAR